MPPVSEQIVVVYDRDSENVLEVLNPDTDNCYRSFNESRCGSCDNCLYARYFYDRSVRILWVDRNLVKHLQLQHNWKKEGF